MLRTIYPNKVKALETELANQLDQLVAKIIADNVDQVLYDFYMTGKLPAEYENSFTFPQTSFQEHEKTKLLKQAIGNKLAKRLKTGNKLYDNQFCYEESINYVPPVYLSIGSVLRIKGETKIELNKIVRLSELTQEQQTAFFSGLEVLDNVTYCLRYPYYHCEKNLKAWSEICSTLSCIQLPISILDLLGSLSNLDNENWAIFINGLMKLNLQSLKMVKLEDNSVRISTSLMTKERLEELLSLFQFAPNLSIQMSYETLHQFSKVSPEKKKVFCDILKNNVSSFNFKNQEICKRWKRFFADIKDMSIRSLCFRYPTVEYDVFWIELTKSHIDTLCIYPASQGKYMCYFEKECLSTFFEKLKNTKVKSLDFKCYGLSTMSEDTLDVFCEGLKTTGITQLTITDLECGGSRSPLPETYKQRIQQCIMENNRLKQQVNDGSLKNLTIYSIWARNPELLSNLETMPMPNEIKEELVTARQVVKF